MVRDNFDDSPHRETILTLLLSQSNSPLSKSISLIEKQSQSRKLQQTLLCKEIITVNN